MKIDNLTLAYWNKIILENIDLNIPKGDFVFLIGKSGSWKTSLISSLIWDFKPFAWNIILDSKEKLYWQKWDFILSYRRKIWVVFQDYKLLESKTVYENVAFAMEVCWYKDEYVMKKVPEFLRLVWLLVKKDKSINQLSGWEKQRLAIARALVHEPDIIIWDEPTGNLDPTTAMEVMKIFDELNKMWKTIIIATHDANIVNHYKKRVVSFDNRKIISDEKKGSYSF